MQQRSELKSKAREMELSDRPEEALQLFLQHAESAESNSPILWRKIGDLQLRLGDAEKGAASLRRAIDGFRRDGQNNNALIACQRLLDARPGSLDAVLEIGGLALELDYREDAREALSTYARSVSETGKPGLAVEPIADFLRRYPDERELWREWIEELYAGGMDAEAADILEALAGHMVAAGLDSVAKSLTGEARRFLGETDDEGPGAEATSEGAALPTLDLSGSFAPESDEDDTTSTVQPLSGFEPTMEGDWEDEEDEGPDGGLPLLSGADESAEGDDEEIPPKPEGFEPAGAGGFGDLVGGDVSPEPAAGLDAGVAADDDTEGEAELPVLGGSAEPGQPSLDEDVPPLPGLQSQGSELPGAGAVPEPAEPADGAPHDLPSWGAPGPTHEEPLDAPPVTADAEAAARGVDEEPQGAGVPSFDPIAVADDILDLTPKDVPEAEDAATHYDLAVAFNGMGLVDEAIAHLATALRGGYDPVATLEVLGEILVGRGNFEETASLLSGLTESNGRDAAEEQVAIYYWLARSHEELDHEELAATGYDRVLAVDENFRDARTRRDRLRSHNV